MKSIAPRSTSKPGRSSAKESTDMSRKFVQFLLCTTFALAVASAQSRPIPQLVKQDGKFRLMVDGKPFLMLGGQVGNFSAYPDMMERAWPGFKAMNLNTVEYPVYWNVIEPEEGRFDFSGFDRILTGLRSQGLRAILLWFGTWKNGAMDWAPNWVKADPQRFPRVIDSGGHPIRSLSPMSKVTLEADRKAYVAMMKHLREVDEADRTVIMVQVENEPGSLGSVRDFSPESNKLFAGPAPAPLVAALKKKPGTWKEVFGRIADEAFNAYYLSSYINEVARAGKEAYPLPAYVNVWNGGYGTNDNFEQFDRPGETYPSGGAVAHMLDLWKANAPAIDAIASDDYHQNPITYLKVLDSYTRPDNPLLIVETGGGIAARGVLLRHRQLFGDRLRSHGRGLGGDPAGAGYGRGGRGLPAGARGAAGDHRVAGDREAQGRGRGARHGGAEPDLHQLRRAWCASTLPAGARRQAPDRDRFRPRRRSPRAACSSPSWDRTNSSSWGSAPPWNSGRCRDRTTRPRNWSPMSKACTRTASGRPPCRARRRKATTPGRSSTCRRTGPW